MKWLIAALIAGALSACAPSATTVIRPKPEQVLIHMKIGMAHDDNPACVAFNVAWAALASGKQVDILYDAGAVFDLQIPNKNKASAGQPASGPADSPSSQPGAEAESQPSGDYPPDMPFSLRYALPDKLRKILSEQFGVPVEQTPVTYFDYLKMLNEKGAHIYVNGGMAHLVSLTDSTAGQERITKLAEPITFERMLELRQRATLFFVY